MIVPARRKIHASGTADRRWQQQKPGIRFPITIHSQINAVIPAKAGMTAFFCLNEMEID
jgi:hypothetical protein